MATYGWSHPSADTSIEQKRKSFRHKICIICYHISLSGTCLNDILLSSVWDAHTQLTTKVHSKSNHNFRYDWCVKINLRLLKRRAQYKISFRRLEYRSHAFCRYTPDKFIVCFRQANPREAERDRKVANLPTDLYILLVRLSHHDANDRQTHKLKCVRNRSSVLSG